ncbi:MAG: HAMP domain-containing histidine kinase [Dysgonamonadaceae bacterium]|jgi:nitrogen-specific signal transduction histidine kinase|nr:HAMP domain-containing histidine kinase [Dysgonamonadaceae bacterium]
MKTFHYLFIITAVGIAIASVWITNALVNELKEEERKKIEVWVESFALLMSQPEFEDLDKAVKDAFNRYQSHLLNIIQDNTTIPVIVTDETGKVTDKKNIEVPGQNPENYLKEKIKKFSNRHEPIVIKSIEDIEIYVYYDDSTVLKNLQLFPFVQLAVVFIFIAVSFLALNSTKKAEQNRVWVGLSKETAHQLGPPISSLMAWVEYLKAKDIDSKLLTEMDKDVQRLKTIAERFSKIGSNAKPELMDLAEAVSHAVEYMGKRISSKVSIKTYFPQEPVCVLMNESLFGWVIENLIKNAVDAMDGQGAITISAFVKGQKAILDVNDTGKGIPKSKFDAIFQPGYTTKKRGWGLGLSLARRIIESYHKGKIFVHKSEVGKETTFRIELQLHNPNS